MFEFGKALLAHCLHDQFFFDDDPQSLTLGFVCSCSGDDQKWVIPLKEVKSYPVEFQNVFLMLKEKAKNPDSPWHQVEKLKGKAVLGDSKERHRRFMRQQKIGAVIVAIDQVLNCKRISNSRRKRLQRRKSRLRAKMKEPDGTPAAFFSMKGLEKLGLA